MVEHIGGLHTSGLTLVTNALFPPVDIAMLTAVLLAINRASNSRLRWSTVAGALALLTLADSDYAYLSVTGRYTPGSLCDIAYIAAFAALAVAASMRSVPRSGPLPRPGSTAAWRVAMPYLPTAGAGVVATYRLASGEPFRGPTLILWTVITALVFARQYLAILDNRRLVTALQQQQERLHTSLLTDPLTGVGNRTLFADRVQHALQLHRRDGHSVMVCWVDLDDFKLVNDSFGHAAGDQVLTILAERMRKVLRTGDTLARVGGDEFGVLLEGADSLSVCQRLLSCTDEPIVADGNPVPVRLSIGTATLHGSEPLLDADELMRRADIAMYSAKQQAGARITRYRQGMAVPGAEDAALRVPLRHAIAKNAIDLHYQPLVDAESGQLRGFEALARWQHTGQPVPPSRFISLAERMGLAHDLGRHILGTAVAQLATWSRRRGDAHLAISVNLSPDQLLDPDLPCVVAELLRDNELEPGQLCLEITEGALLSGDARALENAHLLVESGVRLSLDDFGTGYSSLAHLRGFPLFSLKIDQAFIADLEISPGAEQFLRAIYRLGHDLGLELIAEGVETPSQLATVRSLGPVVVQGYFICRPEPAAYFDELIETAIPTLPIPAHRRRRSAPTQPAPVLLPDVPARH